MNEKELLFDEFLRKRLIKITNENKEVFGNFSEDDSQDYLESIKKIKLSIDKRKSELNGEFSADYFFEKREIELIILIGKYAQDYYLGKTAQKNLTETVKNFKAYLPKYFVLPHPSPRNNIWKAKNEWFEKEVLPELKYVVKKTLS